MGKKDAEKGPKSMVNEVMQLSPLWLSIYPGTVWVGMDSRLISVCEFLARSVSFRVTLPLFHRLGTTRPVSLTSSLTGTQDDSGTHTPLRASVKTGCLQCFPLWFPQWTLSNGIGRPHFNKDH